MSAVVLDYQSPRTNFMHFAKESFSGAFIISNLPLICFFSVKEWERYADDPLAGGETQQHAAALAGRRLFVF